MNGFDGKCERKDGPLIAGGQGRSAGDVRWYAMTVLVVVLLATAMLILRYLGS